MKTHDVRARIRYGRVLQAGVHAQRRQVHRAAIACVVVAGMLSALWMTSVVARAVPAREAPSVQSSFAHAMEDSAADARISPQPELASARDVRVPERFEEELFDVDAIPHVEAQASGNVVGLVCTADFDQIEQAIQHELDGRGWQRVEAAQQGNAAVRGMTFVKSDGRYRWAYCSYRQVAGATSLVVVVQE